MKLSEALKMIHSPKGMSTVIGSILSGDHGPIKNQTAVGRSLAEARLELSKAQNNQKNCQSDMAYWGYAGDVAYWHCVCNLFQAAEITGPDNLPDIPCPNLDGIVMDAQAKLERWGSDVLTAALDSKQNEPQAEQSPRESYPPDWAYLEAMVSPDGRQIHAIGGDREGPDGADNPFVGLERIKKAQEGPNQAVVKVGRLCQLVTSEWESKDEFITRAKKILDEQ